MLFRSMKRGLNEYIIDGVSTNISACLEILSNKDFVEGNLSTGFIPQHFPDGFTNSISEEEKEIIAIMTALSEKNNSNKITSSNNKTKSNFVELNWRKKRLENYR